MDDSSPCQAASADPGYMGYFSDEDLCEHLNELLEAERAGTLAVRSLADAVPPEDRERRAAIRLIGRDEGRFCRMLTRQITGLGGVPSRRRGGFAAKVAALEGFEPRLDLIIRGQRWVERRVDSLLPRVRDDRIHAELRDMRDIHTVNVAACEALRTPAGDA